MKLRTFFALLIPLGVVAAFAYWFFPHSAYLVLVLPVIAAGIFFSWSGLLLLMEMHARKKKEVASPHAVESRD